MFNYCWSGDVAVQIQNDQKELAQGLTVYFPRLVFKSNSLQM